MPRLSRMRRHGRAAFHVPMLPSRARRLPCGPWHTGRSANPRCPGRLIPRGPKCGMQSQVVAPLRLPLPRRLASEPPARRSSGEVQLLRVSHPHAARPPARSPASPLIARPPAPRPACRPVLGVWAESSGIAIRDGPHALQERCDVKGHVATAPLLRRHGHAAGPRCGSRGSRGSTAMRREIAATHARAMKCPLPRANAHGHAAEAPHPSHPSPCPRPAPAALHAPVARVCCVYVCARARAPAHAVVVCVLGLDRALRWIVPTLLPMRAWVVVPGPGPVLMLMLAHAAAARAWHGAAPHRAAARCSAMTAERRCVLEEAPRAACHAQAGTASHSEETDIAAIPSWQEDEECTAAPSKSRVLLRKCMCMWLGAPASRPFPACIR